MRRAQAIRIRRVLTAKTLTRKAPPSESKALSRQRLREGALVKKVAVGKQLAVKSRTHGRVRYHKTPSFPPRVTPIKTALHTYQAYKLLSVGKPSPTVCESRAARREVIFATKRQGRGNHGSYKRTPDSRLGCK